MMVRVSELSGQSLDWAVAVAAGLDPTYSKGRILIDLARLSELALSGDIGEGSWNPSDNWCQCGALLDKHRPWVCESVDGRVAASLSGWLNAEYGETICIAACRAIVAGVIGDAVDVPEELK